MDEVGINAATQGAAQSIQQSDVCVIGGGIAALVFARLLQQRQPTLGITVLDAGGGGGGGSDGKTIVVDHATATCLRGLDALPETSRPINQVRVSVGPLPAKTIGGGHHPLGYAISPREVLPRLREGLRIAPAHLKSVTAEEGGARLVTRQGDTWQARLAVIACPLDALPPPFRTRRFAYRQTVFSCQASGALPPGTARQRFSRRRVLVLVPRAEGAESAENAEEDGDGEIGVIICAANADAGSIAAMSDGALSALLSREFEMPLTVRGRRFAYTPQLARRSPLAAPPLLLLGGGATTLHPIGAQAIALAVEDAKQLAAAFDGGGNSNDSDNGNGSAPLPTQFEKYRRRIHAHRGKALLTSALALGAFGAGGLF